MKNYNVYYAGKNKPALKLVESDRFIVVRYDKAHSLQSLPMSAAQRKLNQPLTSIARDIEAGVELLCCTGSDKKLRKQRDQIKENLNNISGVQFAGKVLSQSKNNNPIIYTENIFIKFQQGITHKRCLQILKKEKLTIKSELPYATRAFFVEAKKGIGKEIFLLCQKLLMSSEIELCHPELVRPMGKKSIFPQQWHLGKTKIYGKVINQHSNVEKAWKINKGENTTIAIIDDGVDTDHEEFLGSAKIVHARDFTNRSNNAKPRRGNSHGTACAGVACANGSHKASGVAPKARLMPLRVRSLLGSQAEANAFYWAADHGADVISCSWGAPDGLWYDDDDPIHHQVIDLPDSTRLAIEYAIKTGRNGKGCVVTWAAGNGNESVDNDGYASNPSVITVAACNDMGGRSSYSDTGDAVWCTFPSSHGEASFTDGIWTTDRTGRNGFNRGESIENTDIDYTSDFGGTSSACPGVAGVAALIISTNPELRSDQVKDIIKNSCDKIDQENGQYSEQGHSPFYGYGRVNAYNAIKLAKPKQYNHTVKHCVIKEVEIKDNKTQSLSLEIADNKVLKDIIVGVEITHSFVGDLIVDLICPKGLSIKSIRLHNQQQENNDNLIKQYDQINTTALSQLIGKKPQGKWRLRVKDTATDDSGSINAFFLQLSF